MFWIGKIVVEIGRIFRFLCFLHMGSYISIFIILYLFIIIHFDE